MKKKRRTAAKRPSVQLTIAQRRNWVKRVISCYTAGYQAAIKKYKANLTDRERANIEAMIATGTLLLEQWTSTIKDTD